MNTDELKFQAWILVGNTLHLLLRGSGDPAHGMDDPRLRSLDEGLQSVPPSEMLEALEHLSPEDRGVLLDACERAFTSAGPESTSVLGLSRTEAKPVLNLLRPQTSAPGQD